MTCLFFCACAAPSKAATMVRAATPDTISDFFIFISPCSSRLGFRFDRPGGNTYTPAHRGCGKEFLSTCFHRQIAEVSGQVLRRVNMDRLCVESNELPGGLAVGCWPGVRFRHPGVQCHLHSPWF